MSDVPSAVPESGGIEGRYANYFQVGHNAFEFVLDFGQRYGPGDAPVLHTRIIANPAYAKRFLEVFADALEAYQRAFGPIDGADPRPDPQAGAPC